MLSRVTTFAVDGVDARRVWVESDVRQGLPAFTVVGLADKAVREARERVRSAMVNSGYEFPLRRITVNLAPAYLRKVGPAFDLPLAVALLVSSEQLDPAVLESCAVVGELSLTGEVRPVRGVLAVAEGARRHGLRRLVVPRARAREAALVPDVEVVGIESLQQLVATLRGDAEPPPAPDPEPEAQEEVLDLADVRGHNALIAGARGGRGRRSQPVHAGAAGHRQDDAGPPAAVDPAAARPGGGARRDADPVGGRPSGGAGLAMRRPFRSPHHTVSAAGLVGGANPPQPGEATLAHHGVLFLDELSEFARPSLEALRQPLEDGHVTIVRGQQVMDFPTRFMLVAASNPCSCGLDGMLCRCSAVDLARHRRRLSGPLLDRIDVFMRVQRPDAEALRRQSAPASSEVAARVVAARERQTHRLAGQPETCNAQLTSRQIRAVGEVTPSAMRMLAELYDRHSLSTRGHTRILRVARTVADLDESAVVGPEHIYVAASLRLDDSSPLAEAA